MQRAPAIVTLLLFAALCASLAYWLLQWMAPAPRAVAAPPESSRSLPPVAAAAALFGGRPNDAGGKAMQLRGIVQVGRAGGSMAIISAEGRPPRAVAVDAEVMPGVTVKEIQERTVVLSERGTERQLSLPAFAAQEAGTGAPMGAQTGVQTGAAPDMPPAAMVPQAPQPAAPPTAQAQPQGTSSVGGGEMGSGAAGGSAPVVPIAPAQAPRTSPSGTAALPDGRSSPQTRAVAPR